MKHPEFESRLNEYVDGTLSPQATAELERHLAECAACREEVEGLRALLTDSARLPRTIEPARDLWPSIDERLDAKETAWLARSRERGTGWRRWVPEHRRLAIAATALIAVSAAAVALLLGPSLKSAEETPPAGPDPATARAFLVQQWERTEAEYRNAAAELEETLELTGATLSPGTRRLIEENLRIVDEAIEESRAALMENPHDRELVELLSATYQKKLDVLQQVVRAASET